MMKTLLISLTSRQATTSVLTEPKSTNDKSITFDYVLPPSFPSKIRSFVAWPQPVTVSHPLHVDR